MNQKEVLKRHFQSGNSLTVLGAIQKFNIYALSQRVGELNREGEIHVISRMVSLPSGKRVARYSLK